MRFRFILLPVLIIYAATFFYFQRWKVNILHGGDAWGYYAYLPSLFIYGDIADMKDTYLARFRYLNEQPALPGPGDVLTPAENGRSINKYTAGVAVLQAPFFVLGHLIAWLSGYPRDGYSLPYMMAIHLANFFYACIGLFLLYRPLSREVGRKMAGIALLTIALASSVFHFQVYRGPMAHSYLFFLYCVLIWATWRFYRTPGLWNAIGIGFSAGLITLTRPVEFVCLAIPLFYGLGMERNLPRQWAYFRDHWKWVLTAAAAFAVCGLLQMVYWKISSGHWIFYSYGEERFSFDRPKIGPGLFGFQNGWLPYSPVMILSLFGLIYLGRHRNWLIPTMVFIPLHVYFAYSWWCWYYINGLGSRPMVEAAPLLAFPLAWFLHYANRQWGMRLLVGAFILFCGALTIFQTWQHHRGILWSEFANAGYYWSAFGKTRMDNEILTAFDSGELRPDTSQWKKAGLPVWKDFETPGPDSFRVVQPGVFGSRFALALQPGGAGSLDLVYHSITDLNVEPGDYVRIKAWCKKDALEFPWYMMPAFAIQLKKGGQNLKFQHIRIDNKLGNKDFSIWGGKAGVWGIVDFYYRIPLNARPNDTLQVYVEMQRQTVYLDDFALEALKRLE